MRKFLKLLIFLSISLNSWAIDLLPKEKSTPTFPNPYSLSLNWWEYYDVDAKTLKGRKTETENYYKELQAALPPDEAQAASPYINRILKGLEVLIEVKSQNSPKPEVVIPKEKQEYTFQQWLMLSNEMLKNQEELEYLKLRRNLALSGYRSSSKEVDTQFSAYVNQNETDPNRLINGLSIIQGRILVAIEKNQVNQIENLISKEKNKIETLETTINNSYENVDFTTANLSEIQNQLQEAQTKVAKAHSKYVLAYESEPITEISDATVQSELSEENLLNAKIEYEQSRVNLINLQVQNLIINWAQKKKEFSRKHHKDQVKEWNSVVSEIQNDIANSENSSELILQQSLKSMALQKDTYSQNFSINTSLDLAEKAILQIQQLKNELYINNFLMSQLDNIRQKYHYSPIDSIAGAWDGVLGFFSAGNWFQQSVFKIGEYPVTVWALIKFFIIIIVSVLLGKLVRQYIHNFGKKQRRIRMASIYILSRISHYVIVILGFAIAGYAIGLDLTIFAYAAGAIALWVGFSLQSIFHNFISGIIVLITKTIRMNDVIELDTGEFGTVVDLNLRTTVIRSYDGKDIVIPNADIVNKKFQNLTLSSHTLRIKVPFRVAFLEDKKRVAKIVIEAAKKVEITSDVNEPEVWIAGYGENYISMELAVWINTLLRGKTASRVSQYYWAIDDAFRVNGIEIPIPVQNIHLSEPPKEFPIGAASPMPIQPKNDSPRDTF